MLFRPLRLLIAVSAVLLCVSSNTFAAISIENLGPAGKLRNDSVVVSPTGETLLQITALGAETTVRVNGMDGPGYSFINAKSLVFTVDGSKFAFIAKHGEDNHVVVHTNGRFEESPAYDRVIDLVVSPVGDRIAWVGEYPQAAGAEKEFEVVVDGVAGPRLTGVGRDSLRFSPDGQHYAYIGQTKVPDPDSPVGRLKTQDHMIFNGVPSPGYPHVVGGSSTKDGEFGFLAQPDRLVFLVAEGISKSPRVAVMSTSGEVAYGPDRVRRLDGGAAGKASYVSFSGDRAHYAVAAEVPVEADAPYGRRDLPLAVHVDGKRVYETPGGSKIGSIGLDRQGQRWASDVYINVSGDPRQPQLELSLVADGIVVGDYMRVSDLQFTDSNARLVYTARTQMGTIVAVDGETFGPFDGVNDVTVLSGSDEVLWLAGTPGKQERLVYLNGEPVEGDYTRADDLLISESGSTWVVQVKDSKSASYIINGEQQGRFNSVGYLTISRDGNHSAFLGRGPEGADRSTNVVVLDGEAIRGGADLGNISELTIDASGRHVSGFGPKRSAGGEQLGRALVVDGFGAVVFDSRSKIPPTIYYPAPDKVAHYAVIDDAIQRITVDIESVTSQGAAGAAAAADTPVSVKYQYGPDVPKSSIVNAFVSAPGGRIYGTTNVGSLNQGMVFASRTGEPILDEMLTFGGGQQSGKNPKDLFAGADGDLYGSDSQGIFRAAVDGSEFTYIVSKEQTGSTPKLQTVTSDGRLFVIASSRLYQTRVDGSDVVELWNPSAENYESGDLRSRGFETAVFHEDSLYGVSKSGNAILRYNLANGEASVVYDFDVSSPGIRPGKLPLAVTGDNRLTGATTSGGDNGKGAIFSMAVDGSDFQVTHLNNTWPNKAPARVAGPDGRWYAWLRSFGDRKDGAAIVACRAGEPVELLMRVPKTLYSVSALTFASDGNLLAYGKSGNYDPFQVYEINLTHQKTAVGELEIVKVPRPTATVAAEKMKIQPASVALPPAAAFR